MSVREKHIKLAESLLADADDAIAALDSSDGGHVDALLLSALVASIGLRVNAARAHIAMAGHLRAVGRY